MNIKHIAEKAGVSTATVSRVLNHPENVAEATRKKIEAIIKEEEYAPNWFARGLNFGTTATIGVMIPSLTDGASIEIAKGIEDVAHDKGYTTLLCNVDDDPEKERGYIHQLVQKKVDGIILIDPLLDKKDYDSFRSNNIAVVVVGENRRVEGTNLIRIDSKEAAREVAAHFSDIGYKKIGIIYGETPECENLNKLKGFREGLQEKGIEYEERYARKVPNTIEGGYLGCKKLLSMEERPEAIFVTSDMMAFGAMDAATDMGYSIPDDIGIVGFDNIRMSSMVTPKLTTMEKPLHKMGVMGARLLFDIIEDGDEGLKAPPKEIMLMSKLRIRKSCGHKERIGEMF